MCSDTAHTAAEIEQNNLLYCWFNSDTANKCDSYLRTACYICICQCSVCMCVCVYGAVGIHTHVNETNGPPTSTTIQTCIPSIHAVVKWGKWTVSFVSTNCNIHQYSVHTYIHAYTIIQQQQQQQHTEHTRSV